MRLDAAQNVGVPTPQRRQRQSSDQFTGYMALMSKCIVTKPSSFQQDPTWFDVMVEECCPFTKFWEILGQVDLFWDFDSLSKEEHKMKQRSQDLIPFLGPSWVFGIM